MSEYTNKYVLAFREAVEKLEEENAATKHFRGDDLHYTKYNSTDETVIEKFKILCKDLSLLQGRLQVLADISLEGKTNSQIMRIKKTVDAMCNLIPHQFGINSPNFAAGDKDAIFYDQNKDGDWTARWANK